MSIKTEEEIIHDAAAAGVSPLGTHPFLDDFALAYHRAVAGQLCVEPKAVIAHARYNLKRWLEADVFSPGEQESIAEWQKILDESDESNVERLIEIITDASEEGQRLRSSSPFVGTISPEERLKILAACEQRAVA